MKFLIVLDEVRKDKKLLYPKIERVIEADDIEEVLSFVKLNYHQYDNYHVYPWKY